MVTSDSRLDERHLEIPKHRRVGDLTANSKAERNQARSRTSDVRLDHAGHSSAEEVVQIVSQALASSSLLICMRHATLVQQLIWTD